MLVITKNTINFIDKNHRIQKRIRNKFKNQSMLIAAPSSNGGLLKYPTVLQRRKDMGLIIAKIFTKPTLFEISDISL